MAVGPDSGATRREALPQYGVSGTGFGRKKDPAPHRSPSPCARGDRRDRPPLLPQLPHSAPPCPALLCPLVR